MCSNDCKISLFRPYFDFFTTSRLDMAHIFTNSELAIFQYVLDILVLGKAHQLPPDSNTIDQLARVAKSSGFMPDSKFKESMRDRPFSTLIDFFLNTAVLSAQNVADLSYARNRL